MRIFIFGISCVGKTTIGKLLAEDLDYEFIDFEREIESFFKLPLARIKNYCLTPLLFRKEMSFVLKHLMKEYKDDFVIAMPPSGLCDYFWRQVRKIKSTFIVLDDKPENILNRIIFYDTDSNPIYKKLSRAQKRYYLSKIKEDMEYYNPIYKRANYRVDISGLDISGSVEKIKGILSKKKMIFNGFKGL